jgi:hypothetical protein
MDHPSLTYLGQDETVSLKDRSNRWIVTRRFKTGSVLVPVDNLLAVPLENPGYRFGYDKPDGIEEDPIHGPYRLNVLSPAAFNQVTGPRRRTSCVGGWITSLNNTALWTSPRFRVT